MKVVLAGGSGHVGAVLLRHFAARKDETIVLSRSPKPGGMKWDGRTLGQWVDVVDGADVNINLAGRSVDSRSHDGNLREMLDSRVDSTRVIGQAIANSVRPPKLWLQASTATIYAHRFDAANDEKTGVIGGDEPGAPRTWNASIKIAKAWEEELAAAVTPRTRKVAMRSAMTMSPDRGSVFDVLASLARLGLGGRLGSGKQYVSWVHEFDFARAVQFLIEHEELEGPVNICSPYPLPQEEFARILREAVGARLALPVPEWLVEIGTWLRQTESELVLKSRRVVPRRLLEAGFEFRFQTWAEAALDLSRRPG